VKTTIIDGNGGCVDARTGGPTSLPIPAGWVSVDPIPVPEPGQLPGVVILRVIGRDGAAAWLYTVTGEVGGAAKRRLRSEQPELDATLRAVAADRAGAALLPWVEYGDPRGPRP
jgi:hypothetical protein